MVKLQRARELRYEDLDALLSDLQALQENGYDRTGNWSLGQAASHIADWSSYPMEGFPTPPAPLRAIFWVMTKTGIAGRMAEGIKTNGFKPGMATAPQTVPASDYDDAEGVAKLQALVAKLRAYEGDLEASPLFGEMDKETHIHVTLLHAAHHLSFLKPR